MQCIECNKNLDPKGRERPFHLMICENNCYHWFHYSKMCVYKWCRRQMGMEKLLQEFRSKDFLTLEEARDIIKNNPIKKEVVCPNESCTGKIKMMHIFYSNQFRIDTLYDELIQDYAEKCKFWKQTVARCSSVEYRTSREIASKAIPREYRKKYIYNAWYYDVNHDYSQEPEYKKYVPLRHQLLQILDDVIGIW